MGNIKLLNAIDKRCSRRTYIDKEIEIEKLEKLHQIIKNTNEESGLNIQFIKEGRELFSSFKSTYGMFSGVNSYIALVGNKNDTYLFQKLGYFGEILVLEATAMGLGTCWIAGTYDKNACKNQINLGNEEELISIISVGYTKENKTLKEKLISGLTHRKTKTMEEMYTSENEVLPIEFINGMKAVQKAPSAMNAQPVTFHYSNGSVTASVDDKVSYRKIDLGIAILHFELGAKTNQTWYLKNGSYTLELK